MTLLAKDRNGQTIQAARIGAVQNITIGATSLQSTAVTRASLVRLTPTVDCYVTQGTNPTASSTTGALLMAGATEYIGIAAGEKIAVIQSSVAGTLNMVECD